MNRYRLLRNNKETGPFTAEELISSGFKPYDLIWVEGKSAGWRYPGELPEFSTVAPIVEEQPFDRFFKKDTVPTNTTPAKELEVAKTSVAIEKAPKKVFVTLPANRTSAKRPEPVVASIPVVKPEVATEFKVDAATRDEIRYNNLIDQFSEAPEKTANSIRSGKRTTRRLIRGALAACLLIGGVIIGFLASNVKQQTEQERLAALMASQRSNESTKPLPVDQNHSNAPTVSTIDTTISASDITSATDAASSMVVNTVMPVRRKLNSSKPQEASIPVTEPAVTTTVSNPAPEERVAVKKFTAPSEDQLMKLVTLQANNYKVGVLGGISNLKITVSNNSSFPLASVIVAVQYLGPEGRIVKEQKVSAESMKAGEQRELEVPKSGRGVKVSYRLDRISASDNAVAQNSGE